VTEPRFRAVVVDDHSLFAETLVIALRGDGVLAQRVIVTPATEFAELESAIAQRDPEVLLLDLELGIYGDVMRLVRGFSDRGVRVVVVTGSEDVARRGEALDEGAVAVIAKSDPFLDIRAAVRRMRRGKPAMSQHEREALLQAYRQGVEARGELCRQFDQLSQREAEVLGMLMDGMQVADIARARFVSQSTVRTQVKAVLSKLSVSSQLSAVGLAHQVGWRPPGEPDRPRLSSV
jgi:two-component system, NarL family, nitrate/nitrite response regulator NarL